MNTLIVKDGGTDMIDWDTQRDVMSKPFNLDTHKRTFTRYLEIILDEDGVAHYAVPSHQDWLINYACEKLSVTQKELLDTMPREYWCDMLTWLTDITSCVAVWDISYVGRLNYAQKSQLELLQAEGLFYGKII